MEAMGVTKGEVLWLRISSTPERACRSEDFFAGLNTSDTAVQ
jgi:hypothetical protein